MCDRAAPRQPPLLHALHRSLGCNASLARRRNRFGPKKRAIQLLCVEQHKMFETPSAKPGLDDLRRAFAEEGIVHLRHAKLLPPALERARSRTQRAFDG